MLPDDVLVEIFFYVNIATIFDWDRDRDWDWDWDWRSVKNPWLALVHVCRRWRYLVLASPRRLNLRLEYGGHGPMPEGAGCLARSTYNTERRTWRVVPAAG